MALAGKAAVIVWNDIAPQSREDFFEWHPRQHMPERLSLPGFLRGRRCSLVEGSVEFLTLYELRGIDVLDSEVYRARLANPTPWSLKVMPGFRNNVRGGCRVLASRGHVMGGFVLTLRLEAEAARRDALLAALADRVIPDVLEQPRACGAHLCVNDASLSGGQVGARQGRFISQPDIVVLVEGSTAAGVRAIGDRLLGDAALVALGARPAILRDLFQLEYSLQNLDGGTIEPPSPATGLHY